MENLGLDRVEEVKGGEEDYNLHYSYGKPWLGQGRRNERRRGGLKPPLFLWKTLA